MITKKITEVQQFAEANGNILQVKDASLGQTPIQVMKQEIVSDLLADGGVALNLVNLKDVVENLSDLTNIVDPKVNDAYQVTNNNNLISVWNGQAWANDFSVASQPTGVVEQGNTNAVSGGEVYNELYIGRTLEIPDGYKNATYGDPLSPNYQYYDSRCIVTDKTKLKSINLVSKTSGSLKILAISLNGTILHSEVKSVNIGINEVSFIDLSTVNETFYVGFEITSVNGDVRTRFPADGEGFSYWKQTTASVFVAMNYRLAYSINISDGGIQGEFDVFTILTKSDTTKIQQSLNKSKKVVFDSNSVTIEDTILVPSGAMLQGVPGSTTINFTNKTAMLIDGRENVSINGLKFKGSQADYAYSMNGINSGANIITNSTQALNNTYKGVEIGLEIKSSENIILENSQFHNINGVGLSVDRVGRDYMKGLKASKLFFLNCYKGIETKNEHEYSNYTDLMISLCQIGFDQDSGNLNVSNPIITRCRYGMVIRGSGINHAHGIVNGAEIKHHQLGGILINNVLYGHLFNGLMMQYANLEILNSEKITIPDLFFSNGIIKCTNTDKVGKNVITNLYDAGFVTLQNTGNLTISNNINLTTNV